MECSGAGANDCSTFGMRRSVFIQRAHVPQTLHCFNQEKLFIVIAQQFSMFVSPLRTYLPINLPLIAGTSPKNLFSFNFTSTGRRRPTKLLQHPYERGIIDSISVRVCSSSYECVSRLQDALSLLQARRKNSTGRGTLYSKRSK